MRVSPCTYSHATNSGRLEASHAFLGGNRSLALDIRSQPTLWRRRRWGGASTTTPGSPDPGITYLFHRVGVGRTKPTSSQRLPAETFPQILKTLCWANTARVMIQDVNPEKSAGTNLRRQPKLTLHRPCGKTLGKGGAGVSKLQGAAVKFQCSSLWVN